jgi:hypothetical protein
MGDGGGWSLQRTVLRAIFPANREIYSEIHDFGLEIFRKLSLQR